MINGLFNGEIPKLSIRIPIDLGDIWHKFLCSEDINEALHVSHFRTTEGIMLICNPYLLHKYYDHGSIDQETFLKLCTPETKGIIHTQITA